MPDVPNRPQTTAAALALLRSLCAAVGAYHGGTHDPHNAQISLNFRTNEDAAAAWQALGAMQEIAP